MNHQRKPNEIVLCFDGTGNQFHGDSSDSNVLKIFRMLDRSSSHQYHYYQPGIGTYVSSASLSDNGRIQKLKAAYIKAKASAIGSTFADHVMGGYKFLMRYYCPGDQIYFFGFSRGAYVARFLAEMLDRIGLLERGNEELVSFAWKSFAKWQQRGSGSEAERRRKEQLKQYMEDFKDTFCQAVTQIQFLGLFDTVNSVPHFENAWMRRSGKFPYTSRTSAKVIRHAVSIDEHRAKFRQDLMSEVKPPPRRAHRGLRDHVRPYLRRHIHQNEESQTSIEDHGPPPAAAVAQTGSSEPAAQDIEEVWFPGCHADIGGGWATGASKCSLSYIPLLWMVHNAQQAGLRFDQSELARFDCMTLGGETQPHGLAEQGMSNSNSGDSFSSACIQDALNTCSTKGLIHDSLSFHSGIPLHTVLSWKIMEFLPFRRMDLREDGSWKPVRWPLPRGEVRDMPDDAKVHVSAIHRLHTNSGYRPGNLIMGGGGRGKLRAPEECGMGDWVVAGHEGCPVTATFMRHARTTTA
ncbi:hypothetical protein BJY04DRAFT_228888 [Aspergillus karnatakaensis]|uniref:T6SS phospholipase effector Tle1-like catalytic domain-containing protein n=1 Tax=Aspergillus karnatakaensis TaxID=1810916 RepID=UPI003CCCA185